MAYELNANYPHRISVSGGLSSAYMLYHLKAANPKWSKSWYATFYNTGMEAVETISFLERLEDYVGVKIICLEFDGFHRPPKIIEDWSDASVDGRPYKLMLGDSRGFMPGVFNRTCTKHLKELLGRRFMLSLGHKRWKSLVGIRADESHRVDKIKTDKTETLMAPMVEDGVTNEIVRKFWNNGPTKRPALFLPTIKVRGNTRTLLGNCQLCFLKGKRQLVQEVIWLLANGKKPVIDWWIEREAEVGKTFSKRHSYKELLELAQQANLQIDMFDNEEPEGCFVCRDD